MESWNRRYANNTAQQHVLNKVAFHRRNVAPTLREAKRKKKRTSPETSISGFVSSILIWLRVISDAQPLITEHLGLLLQSVKNNVSCVAVRAAVYLNFWRSPTIW